MQNITIANPWFDRGGAATAAGWGGIESIANVNGGTESTVGFRG